MDEFKSDGERIYVLWDKYARERDVDRLLSLYAPDAVLETPLIPVILDVDSGVLKGHSELRHFFEEGGRRLPSQLARWHRELGRFFFDGRMLIWEYPRAAPDGDQIELVEVMELSSGVIRHHRVYWGWFGIKQLTNSALAKASRVSSRALPSG